MKHLNRSAFGQNIVSRVEGMVRSGGIPKPEWFDAVRANPPPTPLRAPKPGCLQLPGVLKTDRLLDQFDALYRRREGYRGRAGLRNEVVNLIDGGAAERLGLRFVRRQLKVLDSSEELAKAESWVERLEQRVQDKSAATSADRAKLRRTRRWLDAVRWREEQVAFKKARRMMMKAEVVRKAKITEAERQLAGERQAERVDHFMTRFRHQAPCMKEGADDEAALRELFAVLGEEGSEVFMQHLEAEEYHLKNAVRNTFLAAGREPPAPGPMQGVVTPAGAEADGEGMDEAAADNHAGDLDADEAETGVDTQPRSR